MDKYLPPFQTHCSTHLVRFLRERRGGQPQSLPPSQMVHLPVACHRARCPGTTLLQGQHGSGASTPTPGDSRHECLLRGEEGMAKRTRRRGKGGGGGGGGRGRQKSSRIRRGGEEEWTGGGEGGL